MTGAFVVALLLSIILAGDLIQQRAYNKDLTQENGRLRLANQTQEKKLAWLQSDFEDADRYRMAMVREDFDAKRNIAPRPGSGVTVLSNADLTSRGVVKGEDLYRDDPEPNN